MNIINPYRFLVAGGGGVTVLDHSFAVHNVGTTTTTPSIDSTGADLLLYFVAGFGSLPSLSDSKANSPTGLTPHNSTNVYVKWFYASGAITVGSGHQATIGPSDNFGAVGIIAVSGSNATPIENETGSNGASGTSLAAGSLTAAESGAAHFTGISPYTGSSILIDSGFSSDVLDALTGLSGGMGWKLNVSGAINPIWSWTTSNESASASLIVKPA